VSLVSVCVQILQVGEGEEAKLRLQCSMLAWSLCPHLDRLLVPPLTILLEGDKLGTSFDTVTTFLKNRGNSSLESFLAHNVQKSYLSTGN
jgi:hypothetical protein